MEGDGTNILGGFKEEGDGFMIRDSRGYDARDNVEGSEEKVTTNKETIQLGRNVTETDSSIIPSVFPL